MLTELTAGLAESSGNLPPGLWRDSHHVSCGVTGCTPGSAPGPTLGKEYGRTLPFTLHRNCKVLHGVPMNNESPRNISVFSQCSTTDFSHTFRLYTSVFLSHILQTLLK